MNYYFHSILVIAACILSGCGGASDGGISNSSNQKFEEIKIGNQVWMSTNLNVDRYNNGDLIGLVKDGRDWLKFENQLEGAWVDYDDDRFDKNIYGKLYNSHVIYDPRGIAPDGWRIPTKEDWEELIDFLGDDANAKLKSDHGWFKNNSSSNPFDANGTNESDFNAFPAGSANGMGLYGMKDNAFFWTSTPFTDRGRSPGYYCVAISGSSPTGLPSIFQLVESKAFAIRCIKN